MTSFGRWLLFLLGVALCVLLLFAMKYCLDYAEKCKDNPPSEPKKEQSSPSMPFRQPEDAMRALEKMEQE